MSPRFQKALVGLFGLFLLATTSCTFHGRAEDYHGVDGLRGEPIEYQSTTSVALHGLFVFPLWGDAGKNTVVESFHEEASDRGATRARIAQTSSFTYWFIFPPFSFFIHPVVTSVEGDVEGVTLSDLEDEEADEG